MRAKAIAAVLVLAAIFGCCLPAVAGAAEKPASRNAGSEGIKTLELKGTNGFQITITSGEANGSGPPSVTLEATKIDLGAGSVSGADFTMSAARSQGPEEIVARIGRFGRIQMRFVPESSEEKPSPFGCKGAKTLIETGHYVGFLSFRGAQGFTRVRAHRVAGTFKPEPHSFCHEHLRKPTAAEKEEERTEETKVEESEEVQISVRMPRDKLTFKASRGLTDFGKRPTIGSEFSAFALRREEGVTEISLAFALFGKASLFQTPDPEQPTAEATIHPPAPFLGSATFKRDAAAGPSWTGDLRVELPGFGAVPLTGNGVKASMCQAPRCEEGGGIFGATTSSEGPG